MEPVLEILLLRSDLLVSIARNENGARMDFSFAIERAMRSPPPIPQYAHSVIFESSNIKAPWTQAFCQIFIRQMETGTPVFICQREFVKCEICSCRWIFKENLSKICGKLVPRSFVRAFFGAFVGPNQVI